MVQLQETGTSVSSPIVQPIKRTDHESDEGGFKTVALRKRANDISKKNVVGFCIRKCDLEDPSAGGIDNGKICVEDCVATAVPLDLAERAINYKDVTNCIQGCTPGTTLDSIREYDDCLQGCINGDSSSPGTTATVKTATRAVVPTNTLFGNYGSCINDCTPGGTSLDDIKEYSSCIEGCVLGTSPTSPTTTKAASAVGNTSNTSNTSAATARPNADKGGLSTGAKIGIGVGVTLGFLLVLLLGALCLWRRKKKRQLRDQAPSTVGTSPAVIHAEDIGGGKPELPADESRSLRPALPPVIGSVDPVKYEEDRAELETSTPSNTIVVSELSSTRDPSELHGTSSFPPEPHGQERQAYSELPASPVPAVAGHNPRKPRQSTNPEPLLLRPTTHKMASSTPGFSPDIQTSIMPMEHSQAAPPPDHGNPSPAAHSQSDWFSGPHDQELAILREEHDQLEARRQRILELERLEQQQSVLQGRMDAIRGGSGQL